MPERVSLFIDGEPYDAEAGSSVAAALLQSGRLAVRQSRRGEPRGPLCGMGICFECRLEVNGVANVRSCLKLVESGMEIRTLG